jgi:hypothetical protein
MDLDKKDKILGMSFGGSSDPFLEISRADGLAAYSRSTVVHRTEVIKKNLNPQWREFKIPVRKLCNGDRDIKLTLTAYDWDSDGGHDLIGSCETTLNDLIGAYHEFDLINPKKLSKKRNYKNSGKLRVVSCSIEPEHTFLDYLQNGLELNFSVAIDFTASNGNPMTPSSKHYLNPAAGPDQQNDYLEALYSVGSVVEDYDSDKLIPALGYGGKLPDGTVSHEFPLNLNIANPYCYMIQGVAQAYISALHTVQLYGPTNFAPIIKHVAAFARAASTKDYFILMIITDGAISDLSNTKDAIVEASVFPLSIVIVGVGKADFSSMEQLDGDTHPIKNRMGVKCNRDIVQFVPFAKFKHDHVALCKEVLLEIPEQVVEHYKQRKISPQGIKTV